MKGKTNVQVIKELRADIDRLRHELGRYRKKVKDQREEIEKVRDAARPYLMIASRYKAFMIQTAITCGLPVADEDGQITGYTLRVPRYNPMALRGAYGVESHTDDERGEIVFRVWPMATTGEDPKD